MGLRGFSLKERAIAETRSISKWSSDYFQINHRPLRIAVDQANWWFKNVTSEKEAEIQRKSPGSHPKELRILERIAYLLRLNVQLVFVFDGPNKPNKRRPKSQIYSETNVALLKELLDQLGVPYHKAPGEAEAECAKLQKLGVVDAVWSDDSDTFMFGCTTVVQFYRPEGSEFKSEDDVLVYTADSLLSRSNLSQQGLLMYAILVGCDYADGLPGFGASTFLQLARHSKFQETAEVLAASVSNNHRELSKWRAMVFQLMRAIFPQKTFALPPNDFPNLKVLESCCHPAVSSDDKLIGLISNWFRPFGPNLLTRFIFLRNHFHSRKSRYWPVEYLVPIELNHRLREKANDFDYGITEKTLIGSKKQACVKVDPLLVIPEFLDIFPPGYEFMKVEAILLDCVVQRALPDLIEKTTEKASRGRPRKAVHEEDTANNATRHGTRVTEPLTKLHRPKSVMDEHERYRKMDSGSLEANALRKRFYGPGGQEIPAGSSNTAAREGGVSGNFPIIVNDKNDGNKPPPALKKHEVDNCSFEDIPIIDLTEVD